MSTFIQLHLLTSYPPANLNRDDLGRPKTAVMGGVQRLRISSQSLKRAWRTSELFEEALAGHVGTRTRRIGKMIFDKLVAAGVKEEDAEAWARKIASEFGKLKNTKGQEMEIEQLVHLSPEERQKIEDLTAKLIDENRGPKEEELALLCPRNKAVDIALFGRMLAEKAYFNIEAAAQIAHAITVHKVAVEDDFFTAVDDLSASEEASDEAGKGAGHVGVTEFGSGLFYLYVCINRDLLIKNLQGDETLAAKALRALTEAAATVAPTGKQNSFASRAYASYVLAEKGTRQPRSLSLAFLKPVESKDVLSEAIVALERTRERIDRVYGPVSASFYVMNVHAGTGSLSGLLDFVSSPL